MNEKEFKELNKINKNQSVIERNQNSLYSICIIFGVALFSYIYFYDFDSYSETKLISMTPLWMFPLVFGIYGFVAQKLLSHNNQNEGINRILMKKSASYKFIFPLFPLVFLPFFFIKSRRPIIVALIGSALWVVIMIFFFAVIFPAL